MSNSRTVTQAWTHTQAKYVASKIATDLEQMRSFYKEPAASKITDFAQEAAMLLADRYLSSVEFGFKRNGQIIFSLKYIAKHDGTLGDERPGRVSPGTDVAGASFYSYLTYSDSFFKLSSDAQAKVKAMLPVQRTTGPEPQLGSGYWEDSRTYSASGEGVARKVFRS